MMNNWAQDRGKRKRILTAFGPLKDEWLAKVEEWKKDPVLPWKYDEIEFAGIGLEPYSKGHKHEGQQHCHLVIKTIDEIRKCDLYPTVRKWYCRMGFDKFKFTNQCPHISVREKNDENVLAYIIDADKETNSDEEPWLLNNIVEEDKMKL